MSYTPAPVPALPVNVDPQMRQFLTSIKEALEVRVKQRGNPLDASPTYQDLLDTGLLKITDGITSIGGKKYTASQLLGLVSPAFPTWVTSDTAPTPPTGLIVKTDRTNTILQWDLSAFDNYSHTEIWRATSNNLTLAEKIGSTSGGQFTDGLPVPGVVYYYWLRDVAHNTLAGPFNDVNGVATSLGPGIPVVTAYFIGADVDLYWTTPESNIAVALYKIERYLGGVWADEATVGGNTYRFKALWTGVSNFRVSAIDINDNQGLYGYFDVEIPPPVAPEVSYEYDGEQIVLTITPPNSVLEIASYEIYDGTVSDATLLASQKSTTFRTKVTWLNKTFLVRAVDSAGTAGPTRAVVSQVVLGEVTGLNTTVIDNNVLFKWGNVPGSVPIIAFELRRGGMWETATLIGKKDGGFTTVFESPQALTVYTYWMAAVDSAGNYGPAVSVSAVVAQPPDYVLATNFTSTFTGTVVNAAPCTCMLVLPISLTQTWQSHFADKGWTSPQNQIDAGYPYYAQPGALTGYYEESFDYGTTLVSMKITAAYLLETLGGTITDSVTIIAALDAGFTSNVQTFTGPIAYAINFRYVKVRVTVTATDDYGLGAVSNFTVKLDSKLKNATGAVATNSSGVATVYLTDTKLSTGTKIFVDVDSISVSAASNSSTPLIAIYDFVDTPNPLSFTIYVFDKDGNPVTSSKTVSYTVRGF